MACIILSCSKHSRILQIAHIMSSKLRKEVGTAFITGHLMNRTNNPVLVSHAKNGEYISPT